MRALPNLIRLSKWALDEARRKVSDLETLKDEDDENSESWLVTPAVALGGSDELVVSIDIDKGSFLAGDDAFYFDKPD